MNKRINDALTYVHVNIGKTSNIFTNLQYYRYANIGTDADNNNNISTFLIVFDFNHTYWLNY